MKQLSVIAVLLASHCVAYSFQASQMAAKRTDFKPVSNADLPFKAGEKLQYNIQYGFVKAGEAELQVKNMTTRNNKPVFHMVGTGRTTGMTDWFFHTEDRYETYMDTSKLHPVEFIRDVDEGGYTINRHIFFNQDNLTATDTYKRDTVFQLDQQMQDIFSAFYYARSMDVEGIKVGDEIHIPVFLDHETFPFILRYGGVERVELDDFSVNCMKFTPVVQEGRVFKEEESMTIWVSNDKNRVPIKLKSELAVGSITVELTKYYNLAHPMRIFK